MAPANREGRLHAVSMIRNANRTASLLLAVSAEARAAEMSGEMPVCCRGMLFLLQPPLVAACRCGPGRPPVTVTGLRSTGMATGRTTTH